ncbi:hypothetical protein G7046_g4254 [Stylonectria norvegica]|nr:hypothetical protein G7046_g4254 [Stylonectria norvegica]
MQSPPRRLHQHQHQHKRQHPWMLQYPFSPLAAGRVAVEKKGGGVNVREPSIRTSKPQEARGGHTNNFMYSTAKSTAQHLDADFAGLPACLELGGSCERLGSRTRLKRSSVAPLFGMAPLLFSCLLLCPLAAAPVSGLPCSEKRRACASACFPRTVDPSNRTAPQLPASPGQNLGQTSTPAQVGSTVHETGTYDMYGANFKTYLNPTASTPNPAALHYKIQSAVYPIPPDTTRISLPFNSSRHAPELPPVFCYRQPPDIYHIDYPPSRILIQQARSIVGQGRASPSLSQCRVGTEQKPQEVAELAQLKSETPLCLLRAELPSIAVAEDRLDLVRGPRSFANGPYAGRSGRTAITVDIAALLKSPGSDESSASPPRQLHPTSQPLSTATPSTLGRRATHIAPPALNSSMQTARRGMPSHASEQPVKKQSKWSPEEDALIIELRGSGMKWEDISKRLPGRSAISCRLHYQNYLERRSEWDEERKNKLARLYERFKPEMWAKVAEEMAVPWRAAEAMHWQLGEADMARRAGVIPFSLAAVNVDNGSNNHRNSPSRSHSHSHSQSSSMPRDMRAPSPRSIYSRTQPMGGGPGSRTIVSRRESIPPPPPPPMASDPNEVHYVPGPGLAPIQNQPQPRGGGLLPGITELTTGVSPYSNGPGAGMPTSGSQGPLLPTLSSYAAIEPAGSKRRASDDRAHRETSHRRRMA